MKLKSFSKKLAWMLCLIGIMVATYAGQNVVCAAKTKASNACGKSAVWTYDKESKSLSITGSGKITRSEDWDELEIESIKIGKGVTELGSGIFTNMEKVTSVSLPSTVVKIDYNAFYNCKKLTKVNLPKSLVEIDSSAFYNCKKLKEIKIPDSVTTIGYNVFEGCKALSSVTLSKGMNEISNGMFRRCSNLTEFEIPDYITTIRYGAFQKTGLETITVPDTVTLIENSAFSGCDSLESATWNAAYIASNTFDDCVNLNKVKIGKNVTRIDSYAFSNTAFQKFSIPESVTSVGEGAFSYCENLKKLTITKNVKVVPKNVVANSRNLERVVLEDGVVKIDQYAFNNSYMKSISMPSSVISIGTRAFRNCNMLVSVKIPESVKKINDYTFSNCLALAKVKIGSSVKQIGEAAFYKCDKLESISIPGNVKKIGYKAFSKSGIKSLTLENGVEEVDYWAFSKCPNLESIKIGKDVNKIRNNAFLQCDKLKTITVDKNNRVYASYDNVLYNAGMTKIINCPVTRKGTFTIPAKVSKITGSSFSKCTNITAFAVAPGNSHFSVVDGILYNKNKTVLVACPPGKKGKIKVPNTVKEIGAYAFHYSMASSIELPSSLETIGYSAFEYCSYLKRINIPGKVKTMGNAAFWKCEALKEVEIYNGLTKIPDDAFNECHKLSKITVPVSVTSISSTAFSGCRYDLVFYTKKSSYAMKYATKNYYQYKLI